VYKLQRDSSPGNDPGITPERVRRGKAEDMIDAVRGAANSPADFQLSKSPKLMMRMERAMNESRYTDCGSHNVFIAGVMFPAGEHVIRIPNVNALHRAIALGIVTRKAMMDGREMRFLRTEMGMTQAEFVAMIYREPLTISRWERSETEIDANAETLIRLHAIERLKLKVEGGISEISGWSVPSSVQQPIVIDGSDLSNYRLAA
jgi:DNA-binding transcriptional regulator YiaG